MTLNDNKAFRQSSVNFHKKIKMGRINNGRNTSSDIDRLLACSILLPATAGGFALGGF